MWSTTALSCCSRTLQSSEISTSACLASTVACAVRTGSCLGDIVGFCAKSRDRKLRPPECGASADGELPMSQLKNEPIGPNQPPEEAGAGMAAACTATAGCVGCCAGAATSAVGSACAAFGAVGASVTGSATIALGTASVPASAAGSSFGVAATSESSATRPLSGSWRTAPSGILVSWATFVHIGGAFRSGVNRNLCVAAAGLA
mmetsp:Transcript_103343/g.267289  ORF Transcript_103343/g.267289 Transcript_103343/m.267289 type:complete len:204 (+) Transcript_103343:558-1169(+)